MQVIVDSLLTSYSVVGKGRSILLLHGWGDSSTSFRGLQTSLGNDFKVIAVDLPGFGGSQTPETAWGLDDYAEFVRKFLQKIKEEKLWAIIGHSNGGAIAIRGLAQGNFQADKLILLASAGIRGLRKRRLGALKVATKIGKVMVAPLPASIKRRLRKKLYTSVGSDMLVAEHMQETFKRVVGQDVRADAEKLTVPVLLIYGTKDQETPVAYGEAFRQIMRHAELEVLDSAGHFVHLDQPEAVRMAIAEFLK